MDTVSQVIALVAMVGSGVIGGVFFAFSSFVMRALERMPPAQGLAAMQSINVTVLNPHFLGTFMGTAVVSLGAIVLGGLRLGEPDASFLIAGGALYFAGTFLVTGVCNVPLNTALETVAPTDADASDRWAHYARRWTRWNHARTAAAMLAALSFGIGLLQTG